ncbi:MAG: tetratricopeptide repeat protein [Acidobacteria bacterium]|nr:tetratricopeptide repeat protein [Acidobacteriota bacterium]
MSKVFGKNGILLIFAFLFLGPLYVYGQDLGSSSGIFRSPSTSPKSSSTSAAKTTKPKTATTKSAPAPVRKTAPKTVVKSTPKPTRPTTRTTARRETVSQNRNQTTVYTPPQENIVITVGNQNTNPNDLFEQAVEEGNTARDDRDYVKAENAYRRAQGIQPKDSRAVYGLGNIYADQQRWEEAERAYRQAMQLEPDNAAAYIALSYVLTQPIVGTNLSERYDEAEKMARKAIQIDDGNAFAYDQLGVALELRGNISAETQNAYQKAIQIEPEFALAYAHLGRLLRRNGKSADSGDAYSKAIRFSNDVPTMILVADVMQSQQKYLESEQLLRRALDQDPKNPTALYMLGRALTTRSEFDEAEKVLKRSVEVSPNSFVSYTLLGSLYLRRARLDDAEKILNKALTVVSPNERKRLAQDFEAVGDAFMRIGKPADARRLYRQAMALDGSKTILMEKLAKVKND